MTPIPLIDSLPDLTGAINRHYALRASQLDKFEACRPHFDAAFNHVSPTQRIAAYGEALWACRAEFANEDRVLMGQIGHLCASYSLFGYEAEQRGFRMLAAMRRELGEEGAEQDPTLDPAPKIVLTAPEPDAEAA